MTIDLLISNGTCYFAAGNQTSSNIIPCGNSAAGAYTCCEEGDFCLEYNICYNANYSTTYMAGCTDEEFTSSNCPRKGTSDQELLNLVQCDDSESGGSVVWSACPGPATRTKIGAPEACSCTETDNGILTATTSIPAIASLPTALGETISFASGHTPSKGSATVTSTASNGQLTTMTMAVATSSSTGTSSSSDSASLSTGAKAGIGVGAAALGVGLIALAAFMFTWYRRKHTKKAAGDAGAAYQPAAGGAAPGPDAAYGQSPPPGYASPGYQYNQPVSPMADAQHAGYPGFVGFKSELPAAPLQSETNPAFKSELHAESIDITRNGTPSLLSARGSPAPTGHASMVSDISRTPSTAPSVQQSPGGGNVPDPYGRGPNGGNMTPIAELHG